MSNNNSQLQSNIADLQAVLQVLHHKASGGEQATPEISIDSNGLITATAGDKSMTQQLTTQAAKTITPSVSEQTAVTSGVYTTGTITVAAVPTQTKSIAPTTATQNVTPDSGKFLSEVTVNAMPTATQATPSISVDSSGLITASATQDTGYVTSGTKSATKQLTAQAAQTITPGTSDKTIASGRYLTGTQTIKGDSNLVAENIKSGISIFGVSGTNRGIDTSDATAVEGEIFLNKTAYVDGAKITGSFTIDSELSEQEELLTQLEEILNTKAAGGEASPVLQSKSVSPTTSLQTIVADEGYDGLRQVTVTAMPTATQATPSISIDSSGLITASATQSAGYVSAGTKSATKQLTTKAATTITPTTTSQVAVSAGTYVTGDITVAAAESSGGGTDMRFVDLLHGTITEVDDESITSIKQYGLSYTDALKTVNLPNVTRVAPSAFRECGDLETVNLPSATGSIGSYTFYNCSKLKTVNIPKVTNSSTGVFQNCTELERVDFGTNMATVGTSAFSGCAKLATLIIRGGRSNGTTPPNLSNVNAFANTPIANGTGYIYVSKSLENAYKTATNWSTYANQIRAIEDYPEICS